MFYIRSELSKQHNLFLGRDNLWSQKERCWWQQDLLRKDASRLVCYKPRESHISRSERISDVQAFGVDQSWSSCIFSSWLAPLWVWAIYSNGKRWAIFEIKYCLSGAAQKTNYCLTFLVENFQTATDILKSGGQMSSEKVDELDILQHVFYLTDLLNINMGNYGLDGRQQLRVVDFQVYRALFLLSFPLNLAGQK